MRRIEPGNAPVWEWKCLARRPKAGGLAYPLRGAHRRISKGYDKGGYGITTSKWEYMRRLTKVNDLENCEAIFTNYGGVTGAQAPVERGSVRLAAYGIKSFRSFAKQNSRLMWQGCSGGEGFPPFMLNFHQEWRNILLLCIIIYTAGYTKGHRS
jgi:hypothetical protein